MTSRVGSRRPVRIVLSCLRRIERDYGTGRRWRLEEQDAESPSMDKCIGEGSLGDVLMALLAKMESEVQALWQLAYWKASKDNLAACVMPAAEDDQRAFCLCLAD